MIRVLVVPARVWAPHYTLHKLFAGLQDMYNHCGNKQVLEVVEKMAGWLKGRLDKLDQAGMQRMLNSTEHGGMNETLAKGPDGAELGTVKLKAGQVGAFRVPGAS